MTWRGVSARPYNLDDATAAAAAEAAAAAAEAGAYTRPLLSST